MQASVCPCVTTVSCDVAMTTDYAQRDLLEGKKKSSLRLQRAVKVGARRAACKYQFFEGSESKKEIYVENKKGATDTQHL